MKTPNKWDATKFLTFILFLLLSFTASAADFHTVANGADKDITEHSVTRNVSNDSCGATIFVPTKTAAEWTAFRNNPPACVTVTTATASCPSQLRTWFPGPCFNTWPARAHGTVHGPLSGSNGDGTGSATYTCNNGNWVFTSGSCTPTLN